MNIQLRKKVSHQERLLFTKHLATMIKAGIPIVEALGSLSEQTKPSYFKTALEAVTDDVKNGQALAKSLNKFPKAFDQFYVSLVEVSEESGTLEENLEFLAKQLSKDYTTRKKIKSAMLYPALVMISAVVMGGFIALFVLPQLVDFFDAFEVELPLSTRILLVGANTMKNYGIFIVAGFIAFTMLFLWFIRLPVVKPRWHKLVLKTPLIGRLISAGQLARFSRNLGVLLRSGVPVTRAVEVTANTLSNIKFKKDLTEIGESLAKGKNIGSALGNIKYSEYPEIVSKMVSVGEKTGKLDETLLYLASFYEDEIDDISKNLTTVLEPILLLAIGLAVGFVAIAIVSPIYELTGSIRR